MNKLTAIVLMAVILAISGCSYSQPSKFYRLNPEVYGDKQTINTPSVKNALSVGPVTIPVALTRPQIVTLTGNNEVFISEYDRWAGSMSDSIDRILTDNLSALLPSQTIVPYELGRRLDSSYQLVVDIQQFDGVIGKEVNLKAGWLILEKNTKKPIVVKISRFNEKVQGPGYQDFVAAMSRALGRMSVEMAEAFISLK
jgi:uncharacterized lipoprotein YmbA